MVVKRPFIILFHFRTDCKYKYLNHSATTAHAPKQQQAVSAACATVHCCSAIGLNSDDSPTCPSRSSHRRRTMA